MSTEANQSVMRSSNDKATTASAAKAGATASARGSSSSSTTTSTGKRISSKDAARRTSKRKSRRLSGKELAEVHRRVPSDSQGNVSREALEATLGDMGDDLARRRAMDTLLAQLDPNHTGHVFLPDFIINAILADDKQEDDFTPCENKGEKAQHLIELLSEPGKAEDPQKLADNVFALLDIGNKGTLGQVELERLFAYSGAYDPAELNTAAELFLREMAPDGRGVSRASFVKGIVHGRIPDLTGKILSGLEHHRTPRIVHDPKLEAISQLFDVADEDNSGHICAAEFKQAFTLMSPLANGEMTDTEMTELCDRLFSGVDSNKSGKIEFNNFRDAISPLFNAAGEYTGVTGLPKLEIDELQRRVKELEEYVEQLESENVEMAKKANHNLLDAEGESHRLEDAMADTMNDLQRDNDNLMIMLHDLENKLRHKEDELSEAKAELEAEIETERDNDVEEAEASKILMSVLAASNTFIGEDRAPAERLSGGVLHGHNHLTLARRVKDNMDDLMAEIETTKVTLAESLVTSRDSIDGQNMMQGLSSDMAQVVADTMAKVRDDMARLRDAADESDTALESKTREVANLQATITSLQDENATLEEQVQEATRQAEILTAEAQDLRQENSNLAGKVDHTDVSHAHLLEAIEDEKVKQAEMANELELAKQKLVQAETLARDATTKRDEALATIADLQAQLLQEKENVETARAEVEAMETVVKRTSTSGVETAKQLEAQVSQLQQELDTTRVDKAAEFERLETEKTELKARLDDLSGELDQVGVLQEALAQKQTELDAMAETLTKQTEDLKQARMELDSKHDAMRRSANECTTVQAKLSAKEAEMDGMRERLSQTSAGYLAVKEQLEQVMDSDMRVLEEAKTSMEAELAKVKADNEKLRLDLAESTKTCERLEVAVEQGLQQWAEEHAKVVQVEQTEAALHATQESLGVELERRATITASLDQLTADLEAARVELATECDKTASLEQQVEELSSQADRAPALEEELDTLRADMKLMQDTKTHAIEGLQTEVDSLRAELETVRESMEDQDSTHAQELQSLQNELQVARQSKDRLSGSLTIEMDTLRAELEAAQQALTDMETSKAYKIESLCSELDAMRLAKEEAEVSRDDKLAELQNDMEALQQSKEDAVATLEHDLESLRDELHMAQERVNELEEGRAQDIEQLHEQLRAARDSVEEVENSKLDEVATLQSELDAARQQVVEIESNNLAEMETMQAQLKSALDAKHEYQGMLSHVMNTLRPGGAPSARGSDVSDASSTDASPSAFEDADAAPIALQSEVEAVLQTRAEQDALKTQEIDALREELDSARGSAKLLRTSLDSTQNQHEDLATTNQNLKQQLETLAAELEQVKATRASADKDASSIHEALAEANARIKDLTNQLQTLQNQYDERCEEFETMKTEKNTTIDALTSQLSNVKKELNDDWPSPRVSAARSKSHVSACWSRSSRGSPAPGGANLSLPGTPRTSGTTTTEGRPSQQLDQTPRLSGGSTGSQGERTSITSLGTENDAERRYRHQINKLIAENKSLKNTIQMTVGVSPRRSGSLTRNGNRAVSVRAVSVGPDRRQSLSQIDGLYEAVASNTPGRPTYQRVNATNYTDVSESSPCTLFYDAATSSWCFEHKGTVLVHSADSALLPENVATPWLTRMGQADIDIVEVQVKPSLAETKLAHCEMLYNSLLRQQRDLETQFESVSEQLSNSTVSNNESTNQALNESDERDRLIKGLHDEKCRLSSEVERLTGMLKQESTSRDGLLREIKNRDLAIRELRCTVVRCAQR
eukprot:m.74756 g.74756  ORF g.74756 m.74756 type:complete len:1783 (-) comp8939_c0_seq1:136-5484(-)